MRFLNLLTDPPVLPRTSPESGAGRKAKSVFGLMVMGLALTLPLGSVSATPGVEQDFRLSRRVSLRAEAIPLSRVIDAMGEGTRIDLDVAGPASDERLVAFVQDASIEEVMQGIAGLYRLTWVRRAGANGRISYRLEKPRSTAEEEATLRQDQVRGMLGQLEAMLRSPPAPANKDFGDWRSLYPTVLPLLQNSAGPLSRTGALSIPVRDMPDTLKENVVARLQPILDANRRLFELLEGNFAALRPDGPRIRTSETLSPSQANDCEIIEELILDQELEAWVGLRTHNGTLHRWFNASTAGSAEAGVHLYRAPDRTLVQNGDTAAASWPFAQTTPQRKPEPAHANDWIGQLGRLSQASGVSIFADCYQDLRKGINAHPRIPLTLPERGTVGQALAGWCAPGAANSVSARSHSFWWAGEKSVFIRSSHWLWESQTNLPSALYEEAANSMRRERQLGGGTVAALGALTRFQMQGLMVVRARSEPWVYGVQVPARMSPRDRQLLGMPGGLAWNRIGPEDQRLLVNLLKSPERASNYTSRVTSGFVEAAGQGGTLLNLNVRAAWGSGQGSTIHYLPLPGLTRTLQPKPSSLEVKVKN